MTVKTVDELEQAAPYVVVGGGVHGLSTAYHLAKRLGETGRGSGRDVVVLEKRQVGAGASGIACGVVRNFYFSAPMAEVIRVSVELFESDPAGFGFHPVGYVAAVPEAQAQDVVTIQRRQAEIGYRSDAILGNRDCAAHLEAIFPDFNAEGIEAVLHEHQGGWAETMTTVRNLARLARSEGVRIHEGVEVTGFEIRGRSVQGVLTSHGTIACDLVVVAPGPWAGRFWELLGQPPRLAVRANGSSKPETRPFITYWKLQEGDYRLGDTGFQDAHGREGPVVHLDHDAPLRSDRDGRVIEDGPWGIYFKAGRSGVGVQGGGVPIELGPDCELEPYGRQNPAHVVGDEFNDYFTAGLAWALGRYRGKAREWQADAHGGIGGFTPDNYPVVDYVLPNAYGIFDSNHGFKMIGLGKLVAADLLDGGESRLEPFRLERYAKGTTHAVSSSPYPWN